jgi:hypothetical protein
MESSSEAMRIHMSAAAREQLMQEKSTLAVTSRGTIDVKGKGASRWEGWGWVGGGLKI